MKICIKCAVEQPYSEFSRRKTSKDGLESRCRTCIKAIRREHYRNNKESQFSRNKKYKKALQDLIIERKSVPCTDCGVQYNWWQMQFDHLRDKEFHISNMRQGKERVLAEIAKCEVVCANCHVDRTYKRSHPLWANG